MKNFKKIIAGVMATTIAATSMIVGGAAKTYAAESTVPGDFDLDGRVTVADTYETLAAYATMMVTIDDNDKDENGYYKKDVVISKLKEMGYTEQTYKNLESINSENPVSASTTSFMVAYIKAGFAGYEGPMSSIDSEEGKKIIEIAQTAKVNVNPLKADEYKKSEDEYFKALENTPLKAPTVGFEVDESGVINQTSLSPENSKNWVKNIVYYNLFSGDANRDGMWTAEDATLILKTFAKKALEDTVNATPSEPDDAELLAMDANGDGKVTAEDATKVLIDFATAIAE